MQKEIKSLQFHHIEINIISIFICILKQSSTDDHIAHLIFAIVNNLVVKEYHCPLQIFALFENLFV